MKSEPTADELYKQFMKKTDEDEIQPLRLVVYPSHFEITEAESNDSNRMFRRYSAHRENFLPVSLLDSNGGVLTVEFDTSIEKLIRDRVVTYLKEKIWVGGRLYDFLAYSTSSLKNQRQVYFFCPSGEITAEKIRNEMGAWQDGRKETQKLMSSPCK